MTESVKTKFVLGSKRSDSHNIFVESLEFRANDIPLITMTIDPERAKDFGSLPNLLEAENVVDKEYTNVGLTVWRKKIVTTTKTNVLFKTSSAESFTVLSDRIAKVLVLVGSDISLRDVFIRVIDGEIHVDAIRRETKVESL